jgi:exosortase
MSASVAIDHPSRLDQSRGPMAAVLATTVAFVWLFAQPAVSLARDWWNNPEAGHGLLLAPLAIWLAWRSGMKAKVHPMPVLGLVMIVVAVAVRYLSGLAAEVFTARMAIVLAAGGLIVYFRGIRQVLAWWLPFTLFILSIPLPEVILGAIALPLQFKASQLGAALLKMRGVPVLLTGNVIRLPGHDLFVTEACSGLRSLTAILSLAVLLGGVMLKSPITRGVLLAASVPVAILINGVRVFLTGFLVLFVDPSLGEGVAHLFEGWLLFLIDFALLAALTWLGIIIERRLSASREVAVAA